MNSGSNPFDTGRDDAESPDASSGGLDLSPRSAPQKVDRSGGGSSTKKVVAVGALVLLVAALGVTLFKGLNDAALFYYNVDEAVAKKPELGNQRFRMQGNVIDGSIKSEGSGVRFVIAFGDTKVNVVNSGAPPELFSPEIPVILEGSFKGDEFHSDEIIIRHDNTYDEKHSDRLKDAEIDAKKQSGSQG